MASLLGKGEAQGTLDPRKGATRTTWSGEARTPENPNAASREGQKVVGDGRVRRFTGNVKQGDLFGTPKGLQNRLPADQESEHL